MERIEKIATTVASIVAVLSVAAAVIEGLIYGKLESFLFIFLLILFVICISFIIFIKNLNSGNYNCIKDDQVLNEAFRRRKYERDCKEPNNGRDNGGKCLKLRKSILIYKNIERTLIGHRKEFTVTALVNGVNEFYDRYKYSGEGQCIPYSPDRNQKIIPQSSDGPWNRYAISLKDRPMREGTTKVFKMEMKTIKEPNKTTKPFLSGGIFEPTERLELELQFPIGLHPIDPKIRIYKSYAAATESIEILPKDDPDHFICDYDQGIISYCVDYPIYEYRYELSWHFND